METSLRPGSSAVGQMPALPLSFAFYDYLPSFTRIQSTLHEVTDRYTWWPPNISNPPAEATINVFLTRLDRFIHECEVSRQRKETWERFKAHRMRPRFSSRGDGEILLTVAQLAQDRAHIINYVFAHRVSPSLHQDYVDLSHKSTVTDEDVLNWERDHIFIFWGPDRFARPNAQTFTSNCDGWADRINDKLAAMGCSLGGTKETAIERLHDLFWWDGEPQVSRYPKPYDPDEEISIPFEGCEGDRRSTNRLYDRNGEMDGERSPMIPLEGVDEATRIKILNNDMRRVPWF